MSQGVTHGSGHQIRAYVEAKLSDEEYIADLRDTLYSHTGAASDYRKSDPHLTIIPPFTIDARHASAVEDLLETSGLLDREIPIRGLSVWPSIRNPRVILLDTPVDLESERATLINQLRDLGAREMANPVCPHITLFKTDNGYEVDEFLRDTLRTAIWENRNEWTTHIEYVDLTVVA